MEFESLITFILNTISLETKIFDNTIYQYIYFFGIILLSVLISKIAYFIFKNYIRKITEKTESELDDMLVDIVESPITMLLIILGFYLGAVVVLNPFSGFYSLVINIVKILVIIDVAWLLLRIIDTFLVYYLKPRVEKSETPLDDQLFPVLRKSLKIIVIIITFLFILSNFGYDVTTLLAGLGIGGIAIALAAQDTVSNFLGSVMIFTDKPFKLHDFIKFDGTMGTVTEVGIRSTKLETPTGTTLIIPNNKISTAIIENFTVAKWRRIDLLIGITYDTNYQKLKKAIQLIEQVLKSHSNVDRWDIKFTEFGAYSLNISVWYWIKDPNKYRDTLSEVNLEIKRVFDKNKIEFAFPTQTLFIKK
ncbi:MAG: mechanosensitive ion channel family protein [Candidatus Micrarchaeia archaeon]